MKKIFCVVLLLTIVFNVFSQKDEKTSDVKTGLGYGVLPALTYSSDLGLQYGGLAELFFYGDGSVFPDYLHKFHIQVSQYTKGSGRYVFSYDSKYLIPGYRLNVECGYKPEQAQPFYGFNGYKTQFNEGWQDGDSEDYKSRMYYRLQNKRVVFKADLHIPFNDDLKAIVGFNIQNHKISSVDIDKMNKGRDEDDEDFLPDVPTLYDEYVEWGIIPENEAEGGFVPMFKTGLIYDTRDVEANPMKGMCSDVCLYTAPDIAGSESFFMKLEVWHRQYFTLIEKDLSFAYRLGAQATIAGHAPFYIQPYIDESLSFNRGVMLFRNIGDGMFYGNAELRWKFLYFKWRDKNFYLGLNAFTDAERVIKYVSNDVLDEKMADANYSDYFSGEDESLHFSFGLGFRFVVNQNFIIAADYAKAPNEQDNTGYGFSLGLNYFF